jgi:hypothetical protein
LIVQSSGHRSWALRYRANGRPTKLTLGRWPEISLAGARKLAADALHALSNGVDPGETRVAAKQKAAESEANTVAAVCAEFLRREGKRLRTVDQRERILHRLVYPAIGDRPIDSLKRSEIVRLLDRIEDSSGPRMADVTLAVLRKVLHWHELRDENFVPLSSAACHVGTQKSTGAPASSTTPSCAPYGQQRSKTRAPSVRLCGWHY